MNFSASTTKALLLASSLAMAAGCNSTSGPELGQQKEGVTGSISATRIDGVDAFRITATQLDHLTGPGATASLDVFDDSDSFFLAVPPGRYLLEVFAMKNVAEEEDAVPVLEVADRCPDPGVINDVLVEADAVNSVGRVLIQCEGSVGIGGINVQISERPQAGNFSEDQRFTPEQEALGTPAYGAGDCRARRICVEVGQKGVDKDALTVTWASQTEGVTVTDAPGGVQIPLVETDREDVYISCAMASLDAATNLIDIKEVADETFVFGSGNVSVRVTVGGGGLRGPVGDVITTSHQASFNCIQGLSSSIVGSVENPITTGINLGGFHNISVDVQGLPAASGDSAFPGSLEEGFSTDELMAWLVQTGRVAVFGNIGVFNGVNFQSGDGGLNPTNAVLGDATTSFSAKTCIPWHRKDRAGDPQKSLRLEEPTGTDDFISFSDIVVDLDFASQDIFEIVELTEDNPDTPENERTVTRVKKTVDAGLQSVASGPTSGREIVVDASDEGNIKERPCISLVTDVETIQAPADGYADGTEVTITANVANAGTNRKMRVILGDVVPREGNFTNSGNNFSSLADVPDAAGNFDITVTTNRAVASGERLWVILEMLTEGDDGALCEAAKFDACADADVAAETCTSFNSCPESTPAPL